MCLTLDNPERRRRAFRPMPRINANPSAAASGQPRILIQAGHRRLARGAVAIALLLVAWPCPQAAAAALGRLLFSPAERQLMSARGKPSVNAAPVSLPAEAEPEGGAPPAASGFIRVHASGQLVVWPSGPDAAAPAAAAAGGRWQSDPLCPWQLQWVAPGRAPVRRVFPDRAALPVARAPGLVPLAAGPVPQPSGDHSCN